MLYEKWPIHALLKCTMAVFGLDWIVGIYCSGYENQHSQLLISIRLESEYSKSIGRAFCSGAIAVSMAVFAGTPNFTG